MHGSDSTHARLDDSYVTGHSLRQLFSATGLELVTVRSCAPILRRRARSVVRYTAWQTAALALKGYLALETGQLRGHHVTLNIFFVGRRPAALG